METPQTTHRGYPIKWSENAEKWSVMDLGYSSPKLSLCRSRIDKHWKAEREGRAVAAIRPTSQGHAEQVQIVEYLGPKKAWKHEVARTNVAIMRPGHSGGPARRAEELLPTLILDTSEHRAALESAAKIHQKAQDFIEQAAALVRAIPRVTEADIASLKEIWQTQQADTESRGADSS